jgi:hypothetical protein
VIAQDFTVVNITPDQIVACMVDADLLAMIAADGEHIKARGGLQQDQSQNPGHVPGWLDDTIIPIPEIEAFPPLVVNSPGISGRTPPRLWSSPMYGWCP